MDLRARCRPDAAGPRELGELVAIRSVADPASSLPRSAPLPLSGFSSKFSELGFSDVRLAETADGSQAVVGSRPCSDTNAPTVLLYAHYDVQPPLNEAAWRTPPFQLTEVDGRWYGRGAADCKAISSCTSPLCALWATTCRST